jgi:uncharacterized protein YjbI with pentapeptide repeats
MVRSGRITGSPKLPVSGWQLIKGFLVGTDEPGWFRNVSFSGLDLSGLNLSTVVFDGVNSLGMLHPPATVPDGYASLKGYIVGYKTNLTGANFAATSLSGMNLSFSNLSKADLSKTDLTYVRGTNIIGTPKLPVGWKVIKGILVGPKADLSYLNLSKADLSGVILSGCMVDSLDLSQAKIDRSNSGGQVVGQPKKLPKGWTAKSTGKKIIGVGSISVLTYRG